MGIGSRLRAMARMLLVLVVPVLVLAGCSGGSDSGGPAPSSAPTTSAKVTKSAAPTSSVAPDGPQAGPQAGPESPDDHSPAPALESSYHQSPTQEIPPGYNCVPGPACGTDRCGPTECGMTTEGCPPGVPVCGIGSNWTAPPATTTVAQPSTTPPPVTSSAAPSPASASTTAPNDPAPAAAPPR